MAAQDEGLITLDRLPLGKLKTWLEDNLALEGGANVIGGVSGGATAITVVNNFSETGFMRETGLVVPRPPFHGSPTNLVATADIVYQTRFICPFDMTVSGLKVAEIQNPTGTSKIDVGIYAADGSTLLASSGAVAHSGTNLPEWAAYSFTANLALTEDTEYVVGVLNKINTGTWKYFGAPFESAMRQIYFAGGASAATFMAHGWQVNYSGTGWTFLQNNPAAASAGRNTNVDCPIHVLTIV